MQVSLPYSAADLRRAFWHLRHGGVDGLRRWQRRRRSEGPFRRHGRRAGREPHFEPWPIPQRTPTHPGLRVGVILDDFSRLAFQFEWDQVLLKPSSWREVLDAEPIDMLFVESAWNGNGGAWKYHLTGPTAPRADFRDMVQYCREHGVPTVFWNKEDPAHFEDFLDSARLFKHVFTTDVNKVDSYRELLGHDRVGVLGFGAQPAIHNPIRTVPDRERRDVAFAGMYFAHKFSERREQMDLLLGAADRMSSRMDHGLEIFSRQLGGDPRYQFPAPFDTRVVGSLRYDQMLSAYREYRLFLNVNSVVDSPSMCARRIFEITACGTPVLSAPSAALDHFFPPNEVFRTAEPEEAEDLVRALVRNPELRDRSTHLAQRRIWAEHTYGQRVDQVLDAVGSSTPRLSRPSVSALVSTNRPHQLEHLLTSVGSQLNVPVQLVLVAHGFEPDWPEVEAVARDQGIADLVTLKVDASESLGVCLNHAVDAADGDVVAKMDDDDLYGPHYLSDQLYALDYSGADIVGKQAHYMYLADVNATLLRFAEREHRFTDFVMGPTIVTRRDLAAAHPFAPLTRGEDTTFLADLTAAGCRIYSADRFGFTQVRGTPTEHTWSVTDAHALASGDLRFYGPPNVHALV